MAPLAPWMTLHLHYTCTHATHSSPTHHLPVPLPCRPFLLQAKLSYTQMGLFSLSAYPYSLKLLWSPIVDSVFSASFGR
jgi:hypothetical protein